MAAAVPVTAVRQERSRERAELARCVAAHTEAQAHLQEAVSAHSLATEQAMVARGKVEAHKRAPGPPPRGADQVIADAAAGRAPAPAGPSASAQELARLSAARLP